MRSDESIALLAKMNEMIKASQMDLESSLTSQLKKHQLDLDNRILSIPKQPIIQTSKATLSSSKPIVDQGSFDFFQEFINEGAVTKLSKIGSKWRSISDKYDHVEWVLRNYEFISRE